MINPLWTLLGRYGETEFCQQILDGTFAPLPSMSQYTIEFFRELKRVQHAAPETFLHISKDDYCTGWKKMKEHTSSGGLILHFGHMKACSTSSFLSEFESSIVQIPYSTGYSPTPWQEGTIVMIQKRAQVDLVSKLRTLVLTLADFNHNNKILGRTTMHHAEKHQLLAKEQYGSRRSKSAIEHAFHKRLTYDIMRQSCINGALCSNDAMSCYDRILHSVASLAYQRLGIPLPPIKCMLQSIQNMKHNLCTSYGDSMWTISSKGTLIPYQGILQGNGAAPTTWVVLSTPLLNMMRTARHGGFFTSPITRQSSHYVAFAYVDDTDLLEFNSRDPHITIDEVMEKMQQAVNRWEGGLKTTGGALVPSKSWVYPVSFKFDEEGEWSYETLAEIDIETTVNDHHDQQRTLPQEEAHTAKKTLGVFLAPDGNNDRAVQELRDTAQTWGEKIKTSHIDKKTAWLATESTILKTLQYPLPALTLSNEECTKIMTPILHTSLPKIRVCRNFPRDVVYGPKEEGGLGLTNLYTFQGCSHIAEFMEHLDANDMTGDLLRCSLEYATLEVGIGHNLLTLDYHQYQHLLTDCWFKHLWEFCFNNSVQIDDYVTTMPALRRENDVFLMEVIVNYGYTKLQLQRINRCRQYLQVITLLDILCGSGRTYSKAAYSCQRDSTIPHHYAWSRQPRPGPKSIAIWRKALRQCFPRVNGIIEHRLGNWLYPPEPTWIWFYLPSSQTVYQRRGNRWRIWRRHHARGALAARPKFRYFSEGICLPAQALRATIELNHNNTITLTGWDSHLNGTPFHFMPRNDSSWILDDTSIQLGDNNQIAQSVFNNTLLGVSDGSFVKDHSFGTAGWVFEDTQQQVRGIGKAVTPGPLGSQCSYRSELLGILGIITHILHICATEDVRSGSVSLYCDGEGAIDFLNHFNDYIKTSTKHFDILSSITRAIKSTDIKWEFYHVKGHQDDERDIESLSREAQLNIIADHLAKEKMTASLTSPDYSNLQDKVLPYTAVTAHWIDKRHTKHKLHSTLQKSLHNHIHTSKLREYMIHKSKHTPYQEQLIDWTARSHAHRNMTQATNRWASKWLTGFCGVGLMLGIYKYQKHTKCPRCNADDENVTHVLRCPEPTAQDTWKEEVDKVYTWMIDNKGSPEMALAIQQYLLQWHNPSNDIPRTDFSIDLTEAIRQQSAIGWKSFIEGFWSLRWREHQHQYLQSIHSSRSSVLWISRLQRKIWHIAWSMWLHRNNALHSDGTTIHQYETTMLDREIVQEWNRQHSLPSQYAHMFKGTLQQRLQSTTHQKQRWLASIWSAQEHRLQLQDDRNTHVVNIFE